MKEPNINEEILYEEYKENPSIAERPERRYELSVFDTETDEKVFTGTYFSDETMQEDLYKVDRAFDGFNQELEELKEQE